MEGNLFGSQGPAKEPGGNQAGSEEEGSHIQSYPSQRLLGKVASELADPGKEWGTERGQHTGSLPLVHREMPLP